MARRRKRRPRAWVVVLATLGVLGAAALAALGYLVMVYPQQPGPGRGRVIELELPAGASASLAAARLVAAGALREAELFASYARVLGADARLRTGSVLVYDSMTPRELLQRVAHGYGSAELRVVIPEGFSRFDIARRLARWNVCNERAFLHATADRALLRSLGITGTSAEGWLFPDTYRLRDDMSVENIVRRFVDNAHKRRRALLAQHAATLARLQAELGFGLPEVIALASIVEEEAHVADEQAVIAGVFLNRLRDPAFRPRRLQADPTVAYGCAVQPALPACASFDGKTITRAMLGDAANPYNTYRHDGLPPGPISNPGLSALRAVLEPAGHDYFYFVASGAGRHRFSRSLEEHHGAVEATRPP